MNERRVSRRRLLAAGAAGAGGIALGGVVGADSGNTVEDVLIESHDGTDIAATVYRPAVADERSVPMILHSHGWSGSRTSGEGAFRAELDRGFGVLSFDQRGHGDSGGQANVQNPELEGKDVIEVLNYVSDLEWAARSRNRSRGVAPGRADDPVVFAMGGSYGGAYQLVGAMTETSQRGYTRFDALAPQITWFDLSESLAPEGVVRSAWVAALYALGVTNVPEFVHRAFAYGTATGQWPQGEVPGVPDIDSRFFENGPSGFVDEGIRLDVPVLFGQGLSDNLFNLNQAWHNFDRALTDRAREQSAIVGYNGGHALPNAYPPGEPATAEAGTQQGACTEESFADLRLRFFEAIRDGTGDARELVGSAHALTTVGGETCLHTDALDDRTTIVAKAHVELSLDGQGGLAVESLSGVDGTVAPVEDFPGEIDVDEDRLAALSDERLAALRDVPADADAPAKEAGADPDAGTGAGGHPLPSLAATPTGAGPPLHLDITGGPITIAGIPTLTASVTTAGVDQRLFAGLSVGTSPADAKVVQNNMLPLREPEPVIAEERTIELPGVAVEVSPDERLYLTLSSFSDTSFAHGSSRTPGAVALEDLEINVPAGDAQPHSHQHR